MTVDSAHVVVHAGMIRQAPYVAMTRGRAANHAYVATDAIDPACPHPVDTGEASTGRQILEKALATDGAELSATATLRQRYDEATALSRLVPIRTTLVAAATRERWERLLTTTGLDRATLAAITQSPAAGALCATLDDVARAGHNASEVLRHFGRAAVSAGQNTGDLAAILGSRIRRWLDCAPAVASHGDSPQGEGAEDPPYAIAINEIELLIHHRLDALRQHPDEEDRRRRHSAARLAETAGREAPGQQAEHL